jgi:gliding motility-associated-like protein
LLIHEQHGLRLVGTILHLFLNPMSRVLLVLICVVFFQNVNLLGQCPSLIPNGGFETFSALPNDDCGWALATGWTNAATSSDCNTNNGTPDFYHVQGTGPFAALPTNYYSNIDPFEGDAVMGLGGNISLVQDAREYISIPLINPLVVGNTYTLSFSMSIGSPLVGGLYTNGWGVLFSNGPVYQPAGTNGLITSPGNQILLPEVFNSEEWLTYTFTFTADQAYDQFTFGNFLSDANQTTELYGLQEFISLAYVFVDDFNLQDINAVDVIVDLGPDIALCGTDVTLDATAAQAVSYAWNTGATTPTIVVNAAGIYAVEVTGACGVANDTLIVTNCPPLSISLGADLTICPGEIIALEASVTGGVGPYNFEWSESNSPNASAINVSPTSDNAYSLLVTDAIGNTDSDEVLVLVTPTPTTLDLGQDAVLCPDEIITVDATLPDVIGYDWNTGSTSAAIQINAPGLYALNVTTACITLSDTIRVTSGELDVPNYSNALSLCDDTGLEIGPTIEDPQNFSWLDATTDAFPRIVAETGTYTFVVTDACGTRNFDVMVSEGNCNCSIYVANTFTPNDDGINDTFAPSSDCVFTRFSFTVYNRWGEPIFKSDTANQPWIGNAKNEPNYFVPDGLYTWQLSAESIGSDNEITAFELKGSVNLLR